MEKKKNRRKGEIWRVIINRDTYDIKFFVVEVDEPDRFDKIVSMKNPFLQKDLPHSSRDSEPSTKSDIAELAMIISGAFTKMESKMDDRFTKIGEKFTKIDEKFETIDSRFDQIEKRFDHMDDQFKEVDLKFDGVTEQFDKMSKQIKQTDLKIDGLARRIQGVSNSLDAHTAVCVKREDFDLLDKRVRTMEAA